MSNSKLSNYPNGFKGGVSLDGSAPLHREHSGKVFYVGDSNTVAFPNRKGASDINRGTFLDPLSTLDKADELAVDGRGDVVAILPGTNLDIEASQTITKGGLVIRGLGYGDDRAKVTLNVADALDIEAANVVLENLYLPEPDGAVASRIDVDNTGFQMVGCHVQIADEDVDVITMTDEAHNAAFVGNTVDGEGASEAFVDMEGAVQGTRFIDNYLYGPTAPTSGWVDAEGVAVADTVFSGNENTSGTLFGQTAAVRTVNKDGAVVGQGMQAVVLANQADETGVIADVSGTVDIWGIHLFASTAGDGDTSAGTVGTEADGAASLMGAGDWSDESVEAAGDVLTAATPGAAQSVTEVASAVSPYWSSPVRVADTAIDLTQTGTGEATAFDIVIYYQPVTLGATIADE